MQMLYNSDSFAVVHIEWPGGLAQLAPAGDGRPEDSVAQPQPGALSAGGYEIVDKAAGRDIFIAGALAEQFRQGVQALVETGQASEERFDDFIAGYIGLAPQPLNLH
jgi:hypothetical protein